MADPIPQVSVLREEFTFGCPVDERAGHGWSSEFGRALHGQRSRIPVAPTSGGWQGRARIMAAVQRPQHNGDGLDSRICRPSPRWPAARGPITVVAATGRQCSMRPLLQLIMAVFGRQVHPSGMHRSDPRRTRSALSTQLAIPSCRRSSSGRRHGGRKAKAVRPDKELLAWLVLRSRSDTTNCSGPVLEHERPHHPDPREGVLRAPEACVCGIARSVLFTAGAGRSPYAPDARASGCLWARQVGDNDHSTRR